MLEKRQDADFIIQQIYVKHINVTIKHMKKGIHRIADMQTQANLRQDAYTITKRTINKEQTNTVKEIPHTGDTNSLDRCG